MSSRVPGRLRGLSEFRLGHVSESRRERSHSSDCVVVCNVSPDRDATFSCASLRAAVQEPLPAHQRTLELHKRQDYCAPPPLTMLEDAD